MAARFWRGIDGVAPTDPTVVANWAASSGGDGGATVPGSSDDVTFDGGTENNGNNACTSVGALAWNSLTMTSGYTATFNLDNDTLTITENGNVTLDNSGGTFNANSGTIYMTNGDFDNKDVGTYTYGTSTLSMGGTGTITSSSSTDLYNLTIRSGATITQKSQLEVRGTLTLDGTLSVDPGYAYYALGLGAIVFNDNSTLTGSGSCYLYCDTAGEGITTKHSGSTCNIAVLEIRNPHASAVIAQGTYASANIKVRADGASRTLTLDGTYVFTGNVEFETDAQTLTIANNTNGPSMTFQGNVVFDEQNAGTVTWTKGIGTITASSTAAQSWDWNDAAVEDIVINKTGGTLTFTDGFTADTVDHLDGTVDPNGQTMATVGDWDMAAGTEMSDPESSVFNIGGDATWEGTSAEAPLDLTGSAAWELNCTGTGTLINCDVAYCDASGGTEVDATTGCTNSDNNTNVDFGDAALRVSGTMSGGMSELSGGFL